MRMLRPDSARPTPSTATSAANSTSRINLAPVLVASRENRSDSSTMAAKSAIDAAAMIS